MQTLFYSMGIVVMTLWIIIVVIILSILWKIKRSTDNFKRGFKDKVVNFAKDRPLELASALGLTVAHFVIDKIKKNKKS